MESFINHFRLDYALGETILKDRFEDCATIQEKSLFLITHPVGSTILPDGSGGAKWFPQIGDHILKHESGSGYASQDEALSAGYTFQLDITTLLQDCPFALEVFDYLLKSMEENKPTMVSSEQLETATNHYQKVYEVSQRIEVRNHEINVFQLNVDRLQAERDSLLDRMARHKLANELDQQWLESAKLPLSDEVASKVIPMIINNFAPDSAA